MNDNRAAERHQPAPKIWGVVNITPDSFSDGGKFFDPANALAHARSLLRDGADFIDVGGESTGPGSQPLTAEEEWRRVGWAVEQIVQLGPVSLDTYHAETAERGLKLGVAAINDVSAGRADPRMIPLAADSDALYVMTYAKDSPLPHATSQQIAYRDVVQQLADFFKQRIEVCLRAGFSPQRLIVDPGLGQFVSANAENSWKILGNIERLVEAAHPVALMIGASRKGFLGGILADRDPVSQYVSLKMVEQGVQHVRTHNVAMLGRFVEAYRKLDK